MCIRFEATLIWEVFMTKEDELLVAEICDSLEEIDEKELDDLDFGWCSNCNDAGGNNSGNNTVRLNH